MGIIITVSLATFSKNNRNASFFENRVLEEMPVFSQDKLISGDYFERWENWLTDHAAGRDTLLKIHTWLELNLLRKPVVNDVVVQDKVLLGFNQYGKWDISYLEEKSVNTARNLQDFSDYVEKMDGRFYYVGLPEQYSYFNNLYPDYMENREWVLEPMHTYFAQAMRKYGVNYIDMCAVYDTLNRPKEYYSLTDHHYTFFGALAAYKTLLNAINEDGDMNLNILTGDDMEIIELPNPYLGSRNRKLYGLRYMGEYAAYAVLKDPIPFSRWDNGVLTNAPVYNLPSSNDKIIDYSIYMGNDFAETIICTHREQLPSALIFGDSFTNAMETLLYTAFNETRSLDMRHYTSKTLREYIAEYQPDIVICIRDDTAFFLETGNGNLE
jgi:hypothetical protein